MAKAMLQLNNVTRNFKQGGEKVTALRKTNFTVNAGEFIAVIGPSGSGKSTFLTIAGGLQNPDK
jgi:putative ABC transport system ATP-binding protein